MDQKTPYTRYPLILGFLLSLTQLLSLNEARAFHSPAQTSGRGAIRSEADSAGSDPGRLPGTKPLTYPGDVSRMLLEGAHRFVGEQIRIAGEQREKYWTRDLSTPEAYETSVIPNRARLMKYIGIPDSSESVAPFGPELPSGRPAMQVLAPAGQQGIGPVAETPAYLVYQVRWPVLDRVYGEGLLLQPKGTPVANVIALPDADQLPEQLAGLVPGIAPGSQFARRLAENGCQVLIPVLIDRSPVFPGERKNQTMREWIYRQAYHMGRHLIGYEVQKVQAALDWFGETSPPGTKTGVAGYMEGGLLAFYSAAVDTRIDAVWVSGYFQSRERAWTEPLYRNVWGLLTEFGDAEVASLVAPRSLVVEYSTIPYVADAEEPDSADRFTYTGYKGHLQTPGYASVKDEFDRIGTLLKPGFQERALIDSAGKPVSFGSEEALSTFLAQLGGSPRTPVPGQAPAVIGSLPDPEARQLRQVRELQDHVQGLLRLSDYKRNEDFLYRIMPEFKNRSWSTKTYHPYYPVDRFADKTGEYREFFAEEIIGRFDVPPTPPDPRSRKIYDNNRWSGYEVLLDVAPPLAAGGILLLPKDIREGERRPVVVVQHGRNGVPRHVIEGNTSYNDIGARLAEQGFIVFAPYGLYNGEDAYRWLDKKANTIKKTLFSFVLAQHEQLLRWLGSLPQVDKDRIAFYGKSYGGEMAMRIPAILEGYCLSVCSGDFGDWTRKVVDVNYSNSFMHTIEWEMPYFNMGSTFSYAEMAYLIFPRPFMVERGHDDLVQPDEWVAYEYAKVGYLYSRFNLEDKTEIEYFNGGHASRNRGVFDFLHRHLDWP